MLELSHFSLIITDKCLECFMFYDVAVDDRSIILYIYRINVYQE